MAQYRKIRDRIRGVKSTAKITKAMKMVAAAKLRRAQDAIVEARPYGEKLKEVLGHLAGSMESAISPLFEQREVGRACVVVITADRGLCGPFNSNIIKATTYLLKNRMRDLHQSGNVDLVCIGKRGADYFQKRDFRVVKAYRGIFAELEYSTAQEIVRFLQERFLNGDYDRVELIYNSFKSIIRQEVAVEQFLPVEPITEEGEEESGYNVDYIFEPSAVELLNGLLPKHLNTHLWHALLESNAAEHGARMTAMDNATRNANDLVRDLRLEYNKARQAAITTEILEIVSGANALNA